MAPKTEGAPPDGTGQTLVQRLVGRRRLLLTEGSAALLATECDEDAAMLSPGGRSCSLSTIGESTHSPAPNALSSVRKRPRSCSPPVTACTPPLQRRRLLCPRQDTSSHASEECLTAALSKRETLAPPCGASLPPKCNSVMVSGARSKRSDLQPLTLCPRWDTSSHASKECRATVFPCGETDAPPQGASIPPSCASVKTSGTRSVRSDRQPLVLCPVT